jgi:hypothetical protein
MVNFWISMPSKIGAIVNFFLLFKLRIKLVPKRPRTLIALRFPIERRKMVYYEPITI